MNTAQNVWVGIEGELQFLDYTEINRLFQIGVEYIKEREKSLSSLVSTNVCNKLILDFVFNTWFQILK